MMASVDKIYQAGLNLFGGKGRVFTVAQKGTERTKWIGEHISTPENRLILGITALATQPFIDLSNKKIDEETRKYSVARTIAKIIAGTTTGVIIRRLCIKAIDAFANSPEQIAAGTKPAKLKSFLYPAVKEINLKWLAQYKNTIGSLIALGVFLFTNFLIDAPLTKYLTNKFVGLKEAKDEKRK